MCENAKGNDIESCIHQTLFHGYLAKLTKYPIFALTNIEIYRISLSESFSGNSPYLTLIETLSPLSRGTADFTLQALVIGAS